jgi:hypothetical protein
MMSQFLKYYSYFVLAGMFILTIPIMFLYRVGEYMPLEDVVHKQLQSDGKPVYGTALFKRSSYYKKYLLEASSPRIVALGSSRVLQLRQHMFSEKFVNLGRTMNSIDQGLSFLPYIINSKPEVVLLGIDIWWFNGRYVRSAIRKGAYIKPHLLPGPGHSIKVIKWLLAGKVSLDEIAKSIISDVEDIGLAGQYKDGFGPDGSYYETRMITGKKNNNDAQFLNTISRIKQDRSRFEYEKNVDDERFKKFIKLVRALQNEKIKVITFFLPFADSVNQEMNVLRNKYLYIDDIKRRFNELKLFYLDYQDVTGIGSSNCEFLDGFHGGEVTNMRILIDIAKQLPELAAYLNINHLEEKIEENSGRAFVPDAEINALPEIDFLRIGCKK